MKVPPYTFNKRFKMSEKRLFYTEGRDEAGKVVDKSFYEAHAVGDVRNDVQKRTGATAVEHKSFTSNPDEFYARLKTDQQTNEVELSHVKGLGRRWTVGELKQVEEESIPPFAFAAVTDNGGDELTPYDLEISVNKERGALELDFIRIEPTQEQAIAAMANVALKPATEERDADCGSYEGHSHIDCPTASKEVPIDTIRSLQQEFGYPDLRDCSKDILVYDPSYHRRFDYDPERDAGFDDYDAVSERPEWA